MEDINSLCERHERGRLAGSDARWTQVEELLMAITTQEVKRTAAGIYGMPLEHLVDQVYTAVLSKFISKKFRDRRGKAHIIIRKAARNETISALRRSRSPSSVGFDGAEETWEAGASVAERPGVVAQVEVYLRDFRFPEYEAARGAVLGFFSANGGYPGPAFVTQFGVPQDVARPVYNAAVCDLNTAMLEVVDAR